MWSSTARRVRLPTEIPSNVSWFGTIEHSSDTAKPVSWGVTQGLAWTKPWCERPGIDVDQVTLKLMYLHLNDSTLDAQRALRVSLGGRDQGTEADTWRLELSTTLGLTPRLKLQPAVEYIVNPDSAISRTSPELPRSGWLLGVTLALSRAMLPDLTTTRKNP